MQARVKQDHRWKSVVAFSGHEFIKGEWREVPVGCELEAERHPFLEIKLVELAESGVEPEIPHRDHIDPAPEPVKEPEPVKAEAQNVLPPAKAPRKRRH